MLAVGLPLIAAGLVVAGCSSSGGAAAPTAGSSAPAAAAASADGSAAGSASAPGAAAIGAAADAGVKVTSGHLTDSTGRTLYLFAADTGAASTCNAACLKVWPAVPASGTPAATGGVKSADLSTIKDTGGGSQLAYAGHPLYYFVGDTAAGDAKGAGISSFGAKWFEVTSSGKAITSPSTPSTGKSSSSSSSDGDGDGGGHGY